MTAATKKKPARKKTPVKKKAATGKHPGGRPSKYRADYHPRVAGLLGQLGRTDKEIAKEFGVDYSRIAINEDPAMTPDGLGGS